MKARAFLFRFGKGAVLLGLVSVVLITAYCLARSSRPVPSPVVALDFVKFSSQGTNALAVMSFTNAGLTEVCLWDSVQLWRLVAETPTGRISNTAAFASVGGEEVPPGSNRVFAVPLPPGTTQWRVSTIYGFQKQRHAPSEFHGWVWRSWLIQRTPESVSDAIAWCLDLLPSAPFPSEGEVCTPLLTNGPSSL